MGILFILLAFLRADPTKVILIVKYYCCVIFFELICILLMFIVIKLFFDLIENVFLCLFLLKAFTLQSCGV